MCEDLKRLRYVGKLNVKYIWIAFLGVEPFREEFNGKWHFRLRYVGKFNVKHTWIACLGVEPLRKDFNGKWHFSTLLQILWSNPC